jgi:hypothetical protein
MSEKKVNRERPIKLNFYVSQRELDFIKKKMELAKTKNQSAYIRKMVVDGFILNVNFDELKPLISDIGKIGGNINQIARRINTTGNIYTEDVNEIKSKQEDLWQLLNSLLLEIKGTGKLQKAG